MQDCLLEKIKHEGDTIAIIVWADYVGENGVSFFTSEDSSQQLGYLKHPAGKNIKKHTHKLVRRDIKHTQEVLFIKHGKIRVDLYTKDRQHLKSPVLTAGDVILLASGGHGLEILEDSEIIEIKQGPYSAIDDKEFF